MTILMPIENNRMNNLITVNFIPNSISDVNTIKPLVWKNSNMKEAQLSKRLGLGKFSRINSLLTASDSCDNGSAHSESLTVTKIPLSVTEESSCSSPRRISFTQLDQGEDINLRSILETEHKKPKKTVRFTPQLSTTTYLIHTQLWDGKLSEELCHELWYQKSELAAIKHAAKVAIANRSAVQGNPNASFEELDELIGLERFSKQRAVWKKSAIRCVMMAQRQINCLDGNHSICREDYIQHIAMSGSEWARDAAEKQGFHDYCAVHDPLAALFNDSETSDDEKENKQNYNELIFGDTAIGNTNNKRKVGVVYDTCDEQETVDFDRRTRHRASPPLVL